MKSFLIVCAALLLLAPRAFAVDAPHFLDRPVEFFKTDEGRHIADNILSWQNDNGGWWKGYDVTKPREADFKKDHVSIFDNGATHTEMRLLARAYKATGDPRYKESFDRGLQFIFKSQYPNGGWPQRYPLENNYGRHITFNDEAMVSTMRVLRDIANGKSADGKDDYAFVTGLIPKHAQHVFDRGVDCILATQIKVNGPQGPQLTGWCQQYDEVTLQPAKARSYELPSISGSESVGIAMLLMEIPESHPRFADVKESVRRCAAWFDAVKITGKRIERKNAQGERDCILVDDPAAEPLWARFYDLETSRPYYCDRDGIKKSSLDQIGRERRAGYAWIRPFAAKFLSDAYPKWAAKYHVEPAKFILPPAPAGAPSTQTATAAAVAPLFAASNPPAPTTTSAIAGKKIRSVLAGDSTVTDNVGWGLGFAARFDPAAVEVINLSKGGRSSKSFRDEGHWQKVLDAKPDYVLIQFGHNDQPGKGPTRETDPKTTFRENLSRFVAEARAIGATPVLVTSIERRNYGDDGKIKPSLSAYAEGTRAVAEKENVPLIDLHARTIELYERLGEKQMDSLSPRDRKDKEKKKTDTTHLNQEGGRVIGSIAAEDFANLLPALKPHLLQSPSDASPAK
jgi:PelA/Pel-15E family pectate lyase